ncbi:hypothetical protein D3C71_987830 [compost metagenome]
MLPVSSVSVADSAAAMQAKMVPRDSEPMKVVNLASRSASVSTSLPLLIAELLIVWELSKAVDAVMLPDEML